VHQTANILSYRRVRACDAIGFPSFSRRGLVWLGWNHALPTLVEIWVIRPVLLILHRDVAPQLFGIVATSITNVKRYDLARLRIHRDSDPWFVPFLLDKAPPLIGFGIAPMTATEKAGSLLESNANHASNPEARSS
jgi:hypothetical protein